MTRRTAPLSVALGLICAVVLAAPPQLGGPLPGPFPLFPADNWWNTDVSGAPLDPNSAQLINFIGGDPLKADFGGQQQCSGCTTIYGMPYIVVDASQPKRTVTFTYESDQIGYPIPDEAITQPNWIEHGEPGNQHVPGVDRHMLIVDKDNKYLYELYNLFWDGSKWTAAAGAFFDMKTNNRRPEGWTSTDAAGLAVLPGLVRYDEVYGPDEIKHALRFTVRLSNGYVYPASHQAGNTAGALPMGARLRLKASKDISRFPPEMQKIFRAMKKHGLIVADNGTDMYVQGTFDTRWNNDILNPAFSGLTANDFEVVKLGWKPGSSASGLSVADVSVNEGNSGSVNASFAVSLSPASSSAVTVSYATSNGTATAGSDYTAKSGTLTFAPGETSKTVSAAVMGDTADEPNELFYLTLSSPGNATIADGQANGTIIDDDLPTVAMSINDVSVNEGNSGTTNAMLTVRLSGPATQTVTANYATANATATAGSDYSAASGNLSLSPGETEKTITIPVNGDTVVEANETFVVNLSSPWGATLADSQGQATIINDDTSPASGIPGDFNGDGQGDLLWHHQKTGDLYAWFMNGVSAATASYLTPSRFADVRWQIRGIADFNGDGRTDVLWHHQTTGELYVWMLNGTVTSTGSYLTPKRFSDTNWQIRGTVDFNKDGKTDILWHNLKTGDLYVWFLNGVQTVSGAYLNPSRFADTKWQLRGMFDPNKDGEPDLLWHHQGTGDLYVWFMKGTTAASGSYLTPSRFTDTRWRIVRQADFNKDGTIDILWQHQASGQLYVWYMTGTTATGGAYLNPPAFTDVNWKVMPR